MTRTAMLIVAMSALPLIAGCSSKATQDAAERADVLPDDPTAADLLRPFTRNPAAINGDDYSSTERGLYHCPDQPDLDTLFANLWAEHRASLHAQQTVDRPVAKHVPRHDVLGAAGCTQHRDTVAMARILDWSALDNRREANWDRWIAFEDDPPTDGFYLLFSGSVD